MQKLKALIDHWWSEFTLQTRLMAAATLCVSLVMSGLTFWAVNSIQQDARLNDTRFSRDMGLLLAANVAPQVAESNLTEVARFSKRFYESTSSVRYMLYADGEGDIFLGIPFSDTPLRNSLTIQRKIQLPEEYTSNIAAGDWASPPLVRQHLTPNGEITDVFVPLIHEGKYLGVLAIGINPNPIIVASSDLTRDVTIAVFITIWVMVILGAVFNALTITQPIKELLLGVKNIATGNFEQRINLPFGGELGELIFSFNEMAEKLASYAEQNIEELTSEKSKLETLVSTIADGAVLIDTNLQVILANTTAQRIFGWEGVNPVGENVLHYLPADVTVKLTRPLYQIINNKIPEFNHDNESDEFRLTLSQPVSRTVRILLTRVLDQYRENVKGIAITIQDITREAELNEAKSQFISNVSHELRTPLFNIKSFIETLHEYGDELSNEERKEFLDTANRETDRLTRLVNDVLDLSKLESCRVYHLEPVDIMQSVEQTLRTYRLNARDKGIELKQEIMSQLPAVKGHYDLLLQVFANLVGNALKFTPGGGVVSIRAYLVEPEQATQGEHCPLSARPETFRQENSLVAMNQAQASTIKHDFAPPLGVQNPSVVANKQTQAPMVRIEVADTGIGIDQEDQNAIFDRFFRVENRVHTLEGTGLGLSIVRNIIDKHHTKIHLISEVGVGTTFWFDLEICQEPETISHQATALTTIREISDFDDFSQALTEVQNY